MLECLFRHRCHRVPVQGQEGQLVDAYKRLLRQRPDEVEPEVENLEFQMKVKKKIALR